MAWVATFPGMQFKFLDIVLLHGGLLVSRLYKWLGGMFTCVKCHKEVHIMSFGYGEAICPDCYDGEHPFIFYDCSYLLNRIVTRLNNQKESDERRQLEKLAKKKAYQHQNQDLIKWNPSSRRLA